MQYNILEGFGCTNNEKGQAWKNTLALCSWVHKVNNEQQQKSSLAAELELELELARQGSSPTLLKVTLHILSL